MRFFASLRMTDMRHGRESPVICLDYWIPDYKRRE